MSFLNSDFFCTFVRNNLTQFLYSQREVTRLEQIHKQSPNLKALVAAKTELNMDHTRHVQKLYTKQKYYEFGNKSSCLLAHQLKNLNNDRSVVDHRSVVDPSGFCELCEFAPSSVFA